METKDNSFRVRRLEEKKSEFDRIFEKIKEFTEDVKEDNKSLYESAISDI